MHKQLGCLLSMLVALAMVGCSSGSGGGDGTSGLSALQIKCGNPALNETPKAQLVVQDLQDLQDLDMTAMAAYDQANNGVVSAILGGTTNAQMMNYLNSRVGYYADVTSLHVTPGSYSDDFDAANHPEYLQKLSEDQGVVIALNIGTEMWLNALENNQQVQFTVDGVVNTPTALVNSRTGLVILAGGYSDRVLLDDCSIAEVPPIFREVTLMHEARHSDCPGGISLSKDLPAIRSASTQDAFNTAIHGCGHSHVICPSGPYKGLPACDDESWGAYRVGAVFAAAAVGQDADAQLWNVAQALAIDSKSRLLVPISGTPDMTSAGVVP